MLRRKAGRITLGGIQDLLIAMGNSPKMSTGKSDSSIIIAYKYIRVQMTRVERGVCLAVSMISLPGVRKTLRRENAGTTGGMLRHGLANGILSGTCAYPCEIFCSVVRCALFDAGSGVRACSVVHEARIQRELRIRSTCD
jgi:hypothetical protein